MNNHDELLERAIRRDRAIRASGNVPGPLVESQIVELIVRRQNYSPAVREWILDVSATENMRVSEGVVDAIGQLLGIGYVEDAVDTFSSMLQIKLGDDGRDRRRDVFGSHRRKLQAIFQTADLVDANPNTWGDFLVRLQSQMLQDEQDVESERYGNALTVERPDYKKKDNAFQYRFFSSSHANRDDWGIIARAIELGLAKCIEKADSTAFCCLADRLIASEWGLAVCQPLVALYDHIKVNAVRSWRHDVAIQILLSPFVEASHAAFVWRRLVRKELSPVLTPVEWNSLLTVVRGSQHNERIRSNELKDLEGHVELTIDEQMEIASAERDGTLFPPTDQRDLRNCVFRSGFSNDSPSDRLISKWPFSEDHESLKLLTESERKNANYSDEQRQRTLFARLAALKRIAVREEINSQTWLGEFLGWCFPAIADLKTWYQTTGSSDERAEIEPVEYVQLLQQHAPWWEDRVVAALSRLALPVPDDHFSIQLEHAYWTSDDPIACSIHYLDEVLASPRGSELDQYQEGFVHTIVSAWDKWPKYTRWLATALVRRYYWAQSTELSDLLVGSLANENTSRSIEFSLGHLLRLGRPGITPLMKSIVERIDTLSDPSEIAHLIGGVVGNAVVRCIGNGESQTELAEITEWYSELCARRSCGGAVRLSLVTSILDSAETHLRSQKHLQASHAEVWDQMVTWGLSEWLELSAGTRFDLPTLPITAVIEMRWTGEQKVRLLESSTHILMRVINESDLGGFYHIHLEFQKLRRAYESDEVTSKMFSEDALIQFSKASAARVARWIREGKTTNDYAYWLSLVGDDTRKLILLTMDIAIDRERIRRELAPVVDLLADAGLRDIASQLRTSLRRIG
jgi:hypothetical protein